MTIFFAKGLKNKVLIGERRGGGGQAQHAGDQDSYTPSCLVLPPSPLDTACQGTITKWVITIIRKGFTRFPLKMKCSHFSGHGHSATNVSNEIENVEIKFSFVKLLLVIYQRDGRTVVSHQ